MECNTDGSDTCLTCNNGYALSEDTCIAVSAPSGSYYSVWIPRNVLFITSITIILIIISELLMSSPVCTIWLITSQLRSLLLILLTGTYLSTQVVSYLKYFRFAMLSFKSTPLLKYLDLEMIVNKCFDTEVQNNEGLESIGVYNKTALLVCMPIFVVAAVFGLVHGVTVGVNACVKHKQEYPKLANFVQRLKQVFELSLYLRLVLEGYQILLISSVAEVYRADLDNSKQITSFSMSVVICALCGLFLMLGLLSFLAKSDKPTVFDELYRGLKTSKISSFYPLLCLLKRSLVIVLLVALESLSTRIKLVTMGCIQICHLTYMGIFRPYKHVKDNVIDLLNEAFMLAVLIVLATHQTVSSWDENTVNLIIYGSVANHTVVLLIVLADLAISLFK